ncbi:RAD9, HUS1, RAD1-interacting nuclear orphan protein 1 [Salarias fasciatus]|uniref:Uncharacterized protein n=1 Tax=Salarias fasciatus TaxID=181472 RepID=A0A672F6Y0_SALFA|nr:RAD9, HUS1, RAD1-interacting nuclear orphan protein 1 [Salarias fasciatus]
MPRKAKKTAKPPLLFLEQPSSGSRLKNVPEVRAALNPKEFFSEETAGSSSALHAWVSPQFDRSAFAALPARRGRRRCRSAASILDSCTQPPRKTSVCRYPALSFQTRPRDQRAGVSGTGNKPKKPRCSDTRERPTDSVRKRRHEAETSCRIPAGAPPSTPPGAVDPPPDVETPEVIREESRRPPHASGHFLLNRPPSPPCVQPPDTLAADTPERDYGVKVTWRRRRRMMESLRERGHLSESDTLIQNI